MNHGQRFMTVFMTGIKTIPKKKKCKKAKWLSEEDLQTAVKRREEKNKGEKEIYTHLNAEIQRIARRDKKAFLSNQCKEVEENNSIEKSRKIRDAKGTFHAKVSTIKDKNGKDPTETKEIKKRWQEYTGELYNKCLNDWRTTIVWLFTQSQTSWSVKSSGL